MIDIVLRNRNNAEVVIVVDEEVVQISQNHYDTVYTILTDRGTERINSELFYTHYIEIPECIIYLGVYNSWYYVLDITTSHRTSMPYYTRDNARRALLKEMNK